MVENTGNAYRTNQAIIACAVIIVLAATILLVGYFGLNLLIAAGVFIILAGVVIAFSSHLFSDAPLKFGPSESDYRLIMGLFIALVGATIALYGLKLELYIVIAVFLIGIAAIGLCAAMKGNRTSKY